MRFLFNTRLNLAVTLCENWNPCTNIHKKIPNQSKIFTHAIVNCFVIKQHSIVLSCPYMNLCDTCFLFISNWTHSFWFYTHFRWRNFTRCDYFFLLLSKIVNNINNIQLTNLIQTIWMPNNTIFTIINISITKQIRNTKKHIIDETLIERMSIFFLLECDFFGSGKKCSRYDEMLYSVFLSLTFTPLHFSSASNT